MNHNKQGILTLGVWGTLKCKTMDFFLIVFTEFAEFSDKEYLSIQKLEPATAFIRHQDVTTAPAKTQVRDRIFKLSPIYSLVIYEIP